MFEKITQKYTIIAPHPDDEFLGCFDLFRKYQVKKVIIVTDGRVQTIRKTMLDKKYVEKRKNESINFTRKYCLNNKQIHFLDFPDSELKNIEINVILKSISKNIEKDDIICCPSLLEEHLDHKKVAEVINKLPNKIIYYSIVSNINNSKKTYIKKGDKLKLFKIFYPSQYWRLIKSNFTWRDYEEYSEKI